jgi:GT2 family glycosyltransferase
MTINRVAVVIPNWDGEDMIAECLRSLLSQTLACTVIVVDNGSKDRSTDIISTQFPDVILLKQSKNLGFAEGVNIGIQYAQQHDFQAVALLNNDAIADKNWLTKLVVPLEKNNQLGAVMSKIVSANKKYLDGTGETYTSWGIHYPRGRGKKPGAYDTPGPIFGASGGASLYRIAALSNVGLFDENFFAYYEDVDLSWRLQLLGWKVDYQPEAIVYHKISATSGRIKGFATYQTMKNLPWVIWKNIPLRLLLPILPRFTITYTAFYISAVQRGHIWPATKGVLVSLILLPKKLIERFSIQRRRTVTIGYLRSIIEWDLPPDQMKLRKLRKFFTGKP